MIDRARLPTDLLEAIETSYQVMGACLAGDWGTDLEMLDTARFDADDMETCLATLSNPSPPPPGAAHPITKPTPAWQTPAPKPESSPSPATRPNVVARGLLRAA